MLYQTIDLQLDYKKLGLEHNDQKITLTTYIPDCPSTEFKMNERPMVLICPGGGYAHLSKREGEPIALKLNSLGFNACVLNYSLTPNTYPSQLFEAATAVAMIREHAKEWHTIADQIYICGFSAGAHVAASLGTLWNKGFVSSALGRDAKTFRPDGMLLAYPVITSGPAAHRGSFECLLGKDYDKKLDEVSLEKQVDSDTVKTFIWHTFADQAVPVDNSLLFAQALHAHQIPCELHIFEKGCHGLALANELTNPPSNACIQLECSVWPELFKTWTEC